MQLWGHHQPSPSRDGHAPHQLLLSQIKHEHMAIPGNVSRVIRVKGMIHIIVIIRNRTGVRDKQQVSGRVNALKAKLIKKL